jgi:hypothetical protein
MSYSSNLKPALTKCGIKVRIFIMPQVRTSLLIHAPRVVLGCTLAWKHVVENVGGENGWKARSIGGKSKTCVFSTSWSDRGVKRELSLLLCVCSVWWQYYLQWINDVKHLSEQFKEHESSEVYMGNDGKLKLLGSMNISAHLRNDYRTSVQRHYESVCKNRHKLNTAWHMVHWRELTVRDDKTEDTYNCAELLDLL